MSPKGDLSNTPVFAALSLNVSFQLLQLPDCVVLHNSEENIEEPKQAEAGKSQPLLHSDAGGLTPVRLVHLQHSALGLPSIPPLQPSHQETKNLLSGFSKPYLLVKGRSEPRKP